MLVSARVRLLGCVVLALAAAGVAASRVAPLGPRLAIEVHERFDRATFDVYHVDISSVGGETIERVVLEPLRGSVRVHPPGKTAGLHPGTRYRAIVSVTSESPEGAAIRVMQFGRVDRQYDIELAVEAAR